MDAGKHSPEKKSTRPKNKKTSEQVFQKTFCGLQCGVPDSLEMDAGKHSPEKKSTRQKTKKHLNKFFGTLSVDSSVEFLTRFRWTQANILPKKIPPAKKNKQTSEQVFRNTFCGLQRGVPDSLQMDAGKHSPEKNSTRQKKQKFWTSFSEHFLWTPLWSS